MSTFTISISETNTGTDTVGMFKAYDVFTVSDGNTQSESVTTVPDTGPSDSNIGVDSICMNVKWNLQVSDSNIQEENVSGLDEDWDVPHSPPPLDPIGGVGPTNQTWPLFFSDSNTGIDSGGWIEADFNSDFNNDFSGQGAGCVTPDSFILENDFPGDFSV